MDDPTVSLACAPIATCVPKYLHVSRTNLRDYLLRLRPWQFFRISTLDLRDSISVASAPGGFTGGSTSASLDIATLQQKQDLRSQFVRGICFHIPTAR
jgi:hypothetical protein